ncbi:MAG: hypothetical protein OEV42_03585 [Deltaproteobacteria bacterium]|nr:hypothetical protein [Deltaproteobacteria bacterium]
MIKTELPCLQLLDTSNPVALRDYEERFYQAFIKLEKQALIRQIWRFDDQNRRIETKIPYSDQAIFNFLEKDHIFGAVACNVGQKKFQYSEYGFHFSTNKDNETIRICEILTLFSTKNIIHGKKGIKVCQMLFKHGFTDVLATTAPRPLPLHKRILKFDVIDTTVIDGETRYFIHINLKKLLNIRESKR